jgi:hypothetical protein
MAVPAAASSATLHHALFVDPDTDADLEIVDKQSLVEWFANNYKSFGSNLEYVTNRSQEGSQFVRGFGGIGGILRWKVDFSHIEHNEAAQSVIRAAQARGTAANEEAEAAAEAAPEAEAAWRNPGEEFGAHRARARESAQ